MTECGQKLTLDMLIFPSDTNNLAICGIVTIGMQMAFFLVACTCKFDKVTFVLVCVWIVELMFILFQVTDFAGGTNFVVVAVLTLCLGEQYHWRQVSTVQYSIVQYSTV